jgi:adenylate cyclase
MNREFGSQLLVSDAVRSELGDAAADAVLLGEVAIRGYDAPLPL